MQFTVKAYRAAEGLVTLRLDASSEQEVIRQIHQRGYKLVSLRPQRPIFRFGLRQRYSVPMFSRELLSLVEAGLSLVEAIELMSYKSKEKEATRVLDQLLQHLREGLSLSAALAAQPDIFESMYVAIIRSSELTGDLEQALGRYLEYYKQSNQVREKVISASIYPVILLLVSSIVVLFLLGYVVPRFSHIYEDLGSDLPWMSRMLMQWGQLVEAQSAILLAGFLLFVFGGLYLIRQTTTRRNIQMLIWRAPVIGEKLHLYELARFTRTLAMLLAGGIPFVSALDLVGGMLSQPGLQRGLEQASRQVREGRQVSDAFGENALATEVGVRLITVGERSGELAQSMERIARIYEDQVTRWVEWFTRLFEPLLMAFIGLLIGLIVVLMYLPIFELANNIQ